MRNRIESILRHLAAKGAITNYQEDGEEGVYLCDHSERNHQGRENLLLFPRGPSGESSGGDIQCKQRLGGLLKYYARAA